jgi:hypothetical protein
MKLYEELPETLEDLDTQELQERVDGLRAQVKKVAAREVDFGDLTGEEIVEQTRLAVESVKRANDELTVRAGAEENLQNELSALAEEAGESEAEVKAEGDPGDESDEDKPAPEDESAPEDAEVKAETEVEVAPEAVAEVIAEANEVAAEAAVAEPITAAAVPEKPRLPKVPARNLPVARSTEDGGVTALVASVRHSAQDVRISPGTEVDRLGYAELFKSYGVRLGVPKKSAGGTEEKHVLASASFAFPPERILDPEDAVGNSKKIRAIRTWEYGAEESQALVAAGGLCAPLTPIYDIPNFAVQDRPVRDALVSFNAVRGGVNVPTARIIGDISTAIDVITEADDALGGTFATKSCEDFTCPEFVETAVTIISHCREFGNLNARAWPESIAHENDLTMAAHARTAEAYLLDRIKAQSINVTTPHELSSFFDLVYAITRALAGIRYRLRSARGGTYVALLPEWTPDLLASDFAATQFDRIHAQNEIAALLARYGVSPAWYKDTPSTGTSQGFAAESAGALDLFPAAIQWALFPAGAFIHVDGGSLELGLVRDSSLNSLNNFQMFGETFENVARLAPAQAALWVTSTTCPDGVTAAAVTSSPCTP